MAFDPDKYLAEKAAPAGGFDPDAYLRQKTAAAIPDGPGRLEQLQMALSRGARGTPLGFATNPAVQAAAIKGLGYVSGLGRTAAAGLTGQAGMQDIFNAATGNAPTTKDYLDRKIDGDLGKVETPAFEALGYDVPSMSVTGKQALGFAGDVATDPLTYAGAVGAGLRGVGKMAYKSGVKNLDMEVARYGKEPVSDILFQNRIAGSAKTVANKMEELANKRLAEREAILGRATNAGAMTDVAASLGKADQHIAEMKAMNDPRLNPLIEKMQAEADLLRTTTANPSQMTKMKSNTYSVIGDQGYKEAKSTPLFKRFEKAVAQGQKEEVERTVGQALGDDAAKTLAEKNDELGRLLSSQERAEMDARIAGRKNAFSSVDGMLLGNAIDHPGSTAMLGLKKLADAFKATGPRTYGGLALDRLGTDVGGVSPLLSPYNRALINETDDSPWGRLRSK